MSNESGCSDRTTKNDEYRRTPSVQRYVMLEQDLPAATVFAREGERWVGTLHNGDAVLAMPEIGIEIPLAEFLKLTKHPILLIWGDYIPKQLDKAYAGTPQEARRVFLEQYKLFAQAANKRGGDVRNVVLPEIGISGNTHYAMADTNITQVSRFVSRWLRQKKLD